MKTVIRLAEKTDVPAMLEIYAPIVEQTAISFEEQPPSASEFWSRVYSVLSEAPWLVCEIDDRVIAYAYAGAHRKRAAYRWNRELSVYVHSNFQGRKVGKALYVALFELLQWQGFSNALIGTTLPNETSVGFHESMGFSLVGVYHRVGFKFGKYWDVGWWEKPLKPATDRPSDIIPLPKMVKTEKWRQILKEAEAWIK